VLPVVLVGLHIMLELFLKNFRFVSEDLGTGTYKWETAVCTPADLGLIQINEYPWMTQWSTTAIAGDHALFPPSYGLFVD
jgi:hypothetical protein